MLILAGVSLSLVAGGNGIIGKAAKAVDATTESTAVEEVELAISEANMEYYLDETVTNETLAEYLTKKFSPYTTGSGAEITFSEDGNIQYEGEKGEIILLEMSENGKVEITKKADGTKIQRTVTYDANGGTGSVPAMQNVERKAIVNVDFATLPTREGYNFLGWAITNNATIPHYSENGIKSFTMETNNVTLYAVWQDVLIGADNYGDVANYSANGVEDWKVFLNDGNNIYLIASDYVPNNKLILDSNMSVEGNYGVKGNNQNNLFNWLTTNANWSDFVAEEFKEEPAKATAMGGPTLEQFFKSYNEKYGTEYTSPTSTNVSFSDAIELLYSPHSDSGMWENVRGYYLASPDAEEQQFNIWRMDMTSYDLTSAWYDITERAIRPVVKLPNGILAKKESNGSWIFST